jgi:hypothetical protein
LDELPEGAVQETVIIPPGGTAVEVGFRVYVDGGGVPAVALTVKVKFVVLVLPSPVPVTVIVPAAVEAAEAMFKVREQVGIQEFDFV